MQRGRERHADASPRQTVKQTPPLREWLDRTNPAGAVQRRQRDTERQDALAEIEAAFRALRRPKVPRWLQEEIRRVGTRAWLVGRDSPVPAEFRNRTKAVEERRIWSDRADSRLPRRRIVRRSSSAQNAPQVVSRVEVTASPEFRHDAAIYPRLLDAYELRQFGRRPFCARCHIGNSPEWSLVLSRGREKVVCSDCVEKYIDRQTDVLDIAERGGHFESNRRRH
jgi:hypothetical protein